MEDENEIVMEQGDSEYIVEFIPKENYQVDKSQKVVGIVK